MTICTAAMADDSFDADDEDYGYYRTNPAEWPYTSYAGLLLAYRMILTPSHNWLDVPFEREVPGYVASFFETVVRALERLDAEHLFGVGEDRNNFLLLFGDSDGGPTRAHVQRLNPPMVFARYAENFDE